MWKDDEYPRCRFPNDELSPKLFQRVCRERKRNPKMQQIPSVHIDYVTLSKY